VTVAAVLTSPLQRAVRTCVLAGFGSAAEVESDLLEWNYGAYEGRTSADIRAERPDWQLFMMNGALTIGTRDGATIEMAQEAGEANFFLFGLTAEQVAGSRGWYNPRWHYDNQPEVGAALDLIFSDHFSRNEPGIFAPLRDTLLTRGDHYMHLADLASYLEADGAIRALYADPDAWARKAILTVASSGKFSSDRTIAEYAADIWHVKPCPVS
jgi:starch phosphorylase